MIKLSDIYIGNFPVTQNFGENPDMYKKFGLAGHNGVDWGTPEGTLVVSPFDGEVKETGYDQYGYGNYCKIVNWEMLCYVIMGHQKQVVVSQGQKVVSGQLVGYADNTGNSTGNHLHLGLYKVDSQGLKLNSDNGYGGAINPLDGRIAKWEIKNLTQPIKPDEAQETFLCPKKTFEDLVAKCTKYDQLILDYNNLLVDKGKIEAERNEVLSKLTNLTDATAKQIEGLNQQIEQLTANSAKLTEKIDELTKQLNLSDDEKLKQINELSEINAGLTAKVDDLQKTLDAKPVYETIWEFKRWKLAVVKKL